MPVSHTASATSRPNSKNASAANPARMSASPGTLSVTMSS
jgi:hypothetical protein